MLHMFTWNSVCVMIPAYSRTVYSSDMDQHLFWVWTPDVHRVVNLHPVARRESVCPIHVAAMKGDYDVLVMLLEEGADPEKETSRGRTPMDCALAGDVCGSNQKTVKLLQRALRKWRWPRLTVTSWWDFVAPKGSRLFFWAPLDRKLTNWEISSEISTFHCASKWRLWELPFDFMTERFFPKVKTLRTFCRSELMAFWQQTRVYRLSHGVILQPASPYVQSPFLGTRPWNSFDSCADFPGLPENNSAAARTQPLDLEIRGGTYLQKGMTIAVESHMPLPINK